MKPNPTAKFTPGPWRVEGRSNGWPLIAHGLNDELDGPAGYVAVLQQCSDDDAALMAEAPELRAKLERLEVLGDDLREILGLVCFRAAPFAECLRRGGQEIRTRAEDEQAAAIHWLLRHYLEHGSGWREAANADLKAIRERVEGRAA